MSCVTALDPHLALAVGVWFIPGCLLITMARLTLRRRTFSNAVCRGPVLALCGVSDAWLASAGEDRVVRLWQLSDGALERVLAGHLGAVRALCVLGWYLERVKRVP
jgi:hypothetical protein